MIITLQWYLNCFIWCIYCCWYFLLFGMQNVEKIEDFIIHFLLLTIKVDQVGWIYLLFSSCDYNEYQFLIVLYYICILVVKEGSFCWFLGKAQMCWVAKFAQSINQIINGKKKEEKKNNWFSMWVCEKMMNSKIKKKTWWIFGLCISIAYTICVQPIFLGQFC